LDRAYSNIRSIAMDEGNRSSLVTCATVDGVELE
jgi:hypothetical protein